MKGKNSNREQLGGTNVCVCPECGYGEEHNRGEPCNNHKCPECDTQLTGLETIGSKLKKTLTMGISKKNPGKVDEIKWKKAKKIIKRQYPNYNEEDSSFWKLVNSVYQTMKSNLVDLPTMEKALLLSLDCPAKEASEEFIFENYYLLKTHLEFRKPILLKSRRLQGRIKFQGMDISIENRKGSVRKGTAPNGKEWQTKMKIPYGYIRLTEGADGDHVDCFIGANKDSKKVFVVHQNFPDSGKYDEDKVMLGFDNAEDARKAYYEHYDEPEKFFGSIEQFEMGDFQNKVKRKKGKIISKAKKYSKEDLKAKNMRWVTIRGNHILVQGLKDGSYVVVGGGSGGLNHFKIDKLLSPEEYKKEAQERRAKEVKELTAEEIKEQVLARKEEISLKKDARSLYQQEIKNIVGVDFISKVEIGGISQEAKKIVSKQKEKLTDEEYKQKTEEEEDKLLQKKEKQKVKQIEKEALDALVADYVGDDLDPTQREELKNMLDIEKAKKVLAARRAFKKTLKEITSDKYETPTKTKIGETFAGLDSNSIDDKMIEEVKQHVETAKNIELYEKLDAQALSIQKYIDEGSLGSINGITNDLYKTGTVFSYGLVESLGIEACSRLLAAKLHMDGKAEMAGSALKEFARTNNMKIVDTTLKESDKRFKNADEIRNMAVDTDDSAAILSKASANGYALRQLVRGQQVLGSAVGSLRSAAHIINALEEGAADSVLADVGIDLTRARKKMRTIGLKKGEYSIRTKDNRLIAEIPKETITAIFERNMLKNKGDLELDKIKTFKANNGYLPEGMNSKIKLPPAQEAGLRFFSKQEKVLLDFEAGTGKSLGFDTLINLADGTLRKAGEIFDSNHNNEKEINKEIWLTPKEELKVFSMNEKGKIIEGEVEKVYRQEINNDTFRITTENGFEGGFSYNEPFPVLEYGKIKWKRAFNLEEGDYIVMPKKIPFKGKEEDQNLMELLGWQLSDGYEHENSLIIATVRKETTNKVLELCESMGYHNAYSKKHPDRCECVHLNSKQYRELLESKGYIWDRKREAKDIPDFVMQANNDATAAFIRGYFSGDGYIANHNHIGVVSVSKNIIIKLSYLLLRFGIRTTIRKRMSKCQGWKEKKEYWQLSLGCEGARIFKEEIGFAGCKHKEERLNKMKKLKFPQQNRYPINDLIIAMKEELGVSANRIIRNPRIFKSKRLVTKENIKTIINNLKNTEGGKEYMEDLELILGADIYTTRIKEIKKQKERYLYGLTVKKYHNLICGSGAFVVHNTSIAYAAAMEAIKKKGAKKVLVVTPAKLRSQFYKERKTFLNQEEQENVTLNDKGPTVRKENYKKDGIIITGHDQIRTDWPAIKEAGFDMVVIDEIHEMTNPSDTAEDSGRFDGMMQLKDIPLKIGMSGTNIKNSKKEFYKKINFIDPEHTLGTMAEFENKYKGLNQGVGAFQSSSTEAFRESVSPWSYTQKNNLNVKNTEKEIKVDLTAQQRKMYRQSEALYAEEKSVESKRRGAAARRDSRNYNILHDGLPEHNSKARQIIELMDNDHQGEKAVVHTTGRKALQTLKEGLEQRYGKGSVVEIHGDSSKSKTESAKASFNDPDSPVKFIVGTKSLEAGHNLQFGGTVTFNYDLPPTYASIEQRNKRIYRKGQDRDVTTYTLVSNSPFDVSRKDIIERKKREMEILGNPAYLESYDESGFLEVLNNTI